MTAFKRGDYNEGLANIRKGAPPRTYFVDEYGVVHSNNPRLNKK